MRTTNNTVLITGGGSGIGFEMARYFAELGNTVIISGRNEQKLKNARSRLPGLHYIRCDISKDEDVMALKETIENNYPDLNILVNNAGQAHLHKLATNQMTFEKASAEMMTNYLSVVRLCESLLPVLRNKKESAVINVSSIVAFTPAEMLPTYSASKAALHSYTQALRFTLRDENIKVFEVMPPLVDTDFARSISSPNKIPAWQVAADLIAALNKDVFEIRVASANDLYRIFQSNPEKAIHFINAG